MKSKLLSIVVILSVFFGITGDLLACTDSPEAVLAPFALVNSNTYDLWQDGNGEYYAVVDQTIEFTCDVIDQDDNQTITYTLNYGDGTGPASGIFNFVTVPEHDYVAVKLPYSYGSIGTYTVTLTVNDGSYSDTDTVIIHVGPRRVERATGTYGNDKVWYSYIQHAIDKAATRDTIKANEGVYVENIDFMGKDITVSSTNPGDPEVVEKTVIVGNGLDPTVSFAGTEPSTSTLEGFTITNLIDQGLAAHWTLDGNAQDDVGNNDGTLNGLPNDLPEWQSGRIDGALEFDGANDQYVRISGYKGIIGDKARSITAWIKVTAAGNIVHWGSLTDVGGKWTFLINLSGTGDKNVSGWYAGEWGAIRMAVQGARVVGTNDLRDNEWHHVAVTYVEGGTLGDIKLYVDGVEEDVSYITPDPWPVIDTTSDEDVIIGGLPENNPSIEGRIDDVRIYDRALSGSEIGYMFAEYSTGPVSHWSFDDEVTDTPDNTTPDVTGINHAWLKNSASILPESGISGGSLYIPATGDEHALIPNDPSLITTNMMSISFWVNKSNVWSCGIYKYASCPNEADSPGSSRAYYLSVSQNVGFTVFSGLSAYDSIASVGVVPVDTWTHIAVTFDSGKAEIYINGEFDNSEQLSVTTIMADDQPITVGGYYSYCGTDTFVRKNECMYDDLQIYHRPLTAIEVKNVYYAAKGCYGGGINGNSGNYSAGTLATIRKCIITGNTAKYGGGIYNCDGEISNCTITNNTADADGGGLVNCDGTIVNCLIAANKAENGGGLYSCKADITNCTIVDNTANVDCGGIYVDSAGANLIIDNSIIWGNTGTPSGGDTLDAQIYNPNAATITANYSCIQDVNPYDSSIPFDPTSNNHNIDDDPLFIGSGDYRLTADSLCRNSGDDTRVPSEVETDLDGSNRFTGPVDRGAYELSLILHVNISTTNTTKNGASWGTAFKYLHNALDAAKAGDRIWVAAGMYYPNTDGLSDPRDATFQLPANVKIYGGFAGSESDNYSPSGRRFNLHESILSGNIDLDGTNDNNSYHVVTGADDAVVDGFTIRNGNASGAGDNANGGGLFNMNSSPVFRNCIFKENSAVTGGAVYNSAGSPVFFSCLFFDNSASYGAAVEGVGNGGLQIVNCTITGNEANNEGGAIHNGVNSSINVYNSILWDNIAGGDELYNEIRNNGTMVVEYSSVACPEDEVYTGTGNINADPLFADIGTDDYSLDRLSTCIDKGKVAYGSPYYILMDDGIVDPFDLRGFIRVNNGEVDMGAYENIAGLGFPFLSSFENCQGYEDLGDFDRNGWDVSGYTNNADLEEARFWTNTEPVTPAGSAIANLISELSNDGRLPGQPIDDVGTYYFDYQYIKIDAGTTLTRSVADSGVDGHSYIRFSCIPSEGSMINLMCGANAVASIKFDSSDNVLILDDESYQNTSKPYKSISAQCRTFLYNPNPDLSNYSYDNTWVELVIAIDWQANSYTVKWKHHGITEEETIIADADFDADYYCLTDIVFDNPGSSAYDFYLNRFSMTDEPQNPDLIGSDDFEIDIEASGIDVDWYENDEYISGRVELIGSAWYHKMGYYVISYCPTSLDYTDSGNWTEVCSGNAIIKDSVLGYWETSALENGEYYLKLEIFNDIGQFVLMSGETEPYDPENRIIKKTVRFNGADHKVNALFPVAGLQKARTFYHEEKPDISVQWPGQFPFELKRIYNNSLRKSIYPFFFGWTHNHNTILTESCNSNWKTVPNGGYDVPMADPSTTGTNKLGVGIIWLQLEGVGSRMLRYDHDDATKGVAVYKPLDNLGDYIERTSSCSGNVFTVSYEYFRRDGTVVTFDKVFNSSQSEVDVTIAGYTPTDPTEGVVDWTVRVGINSKSDRFGNTLDYTWKYIMDEGGLPVSPKCIKEIQNNRTTAKIVFTDTLDFLGFVSDLYSKAELIVDVDLVETVKRTINFSLEMTTDYYPLGYVLSYGDVDYGIRYTVNRGIDSQTIFVGDNGPDPSENGIAEDASQNIDGFGRGRRELYSSYGYIEVNGSPAMVIKGEPDSDVKSPQASGKDTFTVIYDSGNRLSAVQYGCGDSRGDVNRQRYNYDYDASGNLITTESFEFYGGDYLYKENEPFALIKEIVTVQKNNGATLSSETNYGPGKNGYYDDNAFYLLERYDIGWYWQQDDVTDPLQEHAHGLWHETEDTSTFYGYEDPDNPLKPTDIYEIFDGTVRHTNIVYDNVTGDMLEQRVYVDPHYINPEHIDHDLISSYVENDSVYVIVNPSAQPRYVYTKWLYHPAYNFEIRKTTWQEYCKDDTNGNPVIAATDVAVANATCSTETISYYTLRDGSTDSGVIRNNTYLTEQRKLISDDGTTKKWAITTYAYNDHGVLTEKVDPKNHQTIITNNAMGQPETVEVDGILTQRNAYDELGQVVLKAQLPGKVTYIKYDDFGRAYWIREYEDAVVMNDAASISLEPGRYTSMTAASTAMYGYDTYDNRTFEKKPEYTSETSIRFGYFSSELGKPTILRYVNPDVPDLTGEFEWKSKSDQISIEYFGDLERHSRHRYGHGDGSSYYWGPYSIDSGREYDAEKRLVNQWAITKTVQWDNSHDFCVSGYYELMADLLTANSDWVLSLPHEAINKVTSYYGSGNKKFDKCYKLQVIDGVISDPMLLSQTNYTYDILGRMTKQIVDPYGISGSTPLAITTEYGYDATGNKLYIVDPSGNFIFSDYDNSGRKKAEYFAVEPVYDPGTTDIDIALTKANADIKQEVEYYDNDKVKNVTHYDYNGVILKYSEFEYDGQGRITKTTQRIDDTPTTNAVTTFEYFDNGEISAAFDLDDDGAGPDTQQPYHIKITDAENKVTYVGLNAFGKATKTKYPSGDCQEMVYNGVGQLVKKAVWDGGTKKWIEYSYNYFGNLESIDYPDSPFTKDTIYKYFPYSSKNVTQIIDRRYLGKYTGLESDETAGDIYDLEYDAYDNLITYSVSSYEATKPDYSIEYTYNYANNAKESIIVKNVDGDIIYESNFGYDAAGRPNYVGADGSSASPRAIASIGYDANGNRNMLTYSLDGTIDAVDTDFLTMSYDSNIDNYLESIISSSDIAPSTTFFSFDATAEGQIDGLGRLIQAQETLTQAGGSDYTTKSQFAYDMLSELTAAGIDDDTYTTNGDIWKVSYDYYKDGNITQKTEQGTAVNFAFDGDLMTYMGLNELTWDLNGVMTTGPTATFKYDSRSKLSHAEWESGTMDICYDPFGNRISKRTDATHHYIVDINGKLPTILMEVDALEVVKSYYYSNAQILAQDTTQKQIHSDYTVINDISDLQDIWNDTSKWDDYIVLASDISLSVNIVPIGTAATPFTGVFDGAGHTISNVTCPGYTGNEIGFFGHVSGDAVIKDITLSGVSALGTGSYDNIGSLVGYLGKGLVDNCQVQGTATSAIGGRASVGGLVGYIDTDGIVSNSRVMDMDVAASVEDAGGIAGTVRGKIIHCLVEDCTLTSGYAAGGIAGEVIDSAIIKNCVVDNCGIQCNDRVGGIIGSFISGYLTNSGVESGSVDGNTYAGGCIGYHGARVDNCYSSASVNSSGIYGGGFIGTNEGDVANCHSYNNRSFIDTNNSGTISACFSLTSPAVRLGSATGVTWLNAAGFASSTSFDSVGWDFIDTWIMDIANGYPVLQINDWSPVTAQQGAWYYYLHDRLGSIRAVVDENADILHAYSYNPFGETLTHTVTAGAPTTPWRFTGQWYDAEIAQYYLRARQYDPQMMRFTGRDPVRGKQNEPLTLHKYLYCLNDPINMYDPSGEMGEFEMMHDLSKAATAHSMSIGAVAYSVDTGNEAFFEIGLQLNQIAADMYYNTAMANLASLPLSTAVGFIDPLYITELGTIAELALFNKLIGEKLGGRDNPFIRPLFHEAINESGAFITGNEFYDYLDWLY